MKKLFIIIFLFISFQSLTKADEVQDFQIEGISVGDSALDFLSVSKIEKIKANDPQNGYLYKVKDFYALTFYDLISLQKIKK